MKYDFIEIGTSDFDTLIETADDNTVGLSIEPLKYYLDRLPDKPKVTKLNMAISSQESSLAIYYIPENQIIKHKLPYWVRGSNSIGGPHKFTIQEIGKELYEQIVQVKTIRATTLRNIVTEFEVDSIEFLKIDTEGMDHIILESLVELCKERKELCPNKIKFERNPSVSNIEETDKVLVELKKLGYTISLSQNDGVAMLTQIPRIIHQTFKDDNFSPELQKSINGLKKMNPTFEYRFYNDQDCIDFIKTNYPAEYLQDYLSIDPIYGAARADLFRYLLMYKVGGVYLDIKSSTIEPLEDHLLVTDEYILTHWEGKDWSEMLGYEHGEFQNWHIICRPGHPFLEATIKQVRENIHNYSGALGKEAVLELTGPIAYSKAIIPMLEEYRKMSLDSPVREFASETEMGLMYLGSTVHHHFLYPNSYHRTEPIVMKTSSKFERAWVLYANEAYIPTLQACVDSLNTVSRYPIFVYLINSYKQIKGATTIHWECEVPIVNTQSAFIDRKDPDIYMMMKERPMIVKDALQKYALTICYVDSDVVATNWVNQVFKYYDSTCKYPYFTEGIYDYLHIDGRGGADTREDMSTTLEAPACDLFNINQYVRQKYRQTGFFVAGQNTINFLDEWYQMCSHPEVINNHPWYAPFHEETLANVLLWKYNYLEGLPYIYCNASLPRLQAVLNGEYKYGEHYESWFRLPDKKEELFFIHGEKSPEIMNQMTELISSNKLNNKKMRIMFLAPHLSTGGMPAFLQKRIEALQEYCDVEIYVVEYQCYSMDFVVQRNAIKKLVGDNFQTLYENKMDLLTTIKRWKPDVVHIDEMTERMDPLMVAALYSENRRYKIIETCHDISFTPQDKQFHPDTYAFCTPYHLDTFAKNLSEKKVIEFPIDAHSVTKAIKLNAKKSLSLDPTIKHVLNVGLWTKGKNQGEGLEIARKYPDMQFHFVGNQAGNFEEYWKPLMKNVPSNVTIWGERKDVPLFLQAADIFMFNSVWECNPLVLREAISYKLPIIAHNLPQYGTMLTKYIQPIDTDLNTIKVNYKVPTNKTTEDFAKNHFKMYEDTKIVTRSHTSIIQHFVDGPYLEIKGNSTKDFKIHFYDETGKLHYEHTTKSNHWVSLNRKWFTKWNAKVWEEDDLIYDNTLNLTNQRVYITFESEALGDTIAWMPYVLEFKKKHNCHVIVSTFKNFLFEKMYPEIEFVKPGVTVHNLYALYRIGYFYNDTKEPVYPNSIPLQKAACNILGLDYKEIIPKIDFTPKKRLYKFKYVTIATNATSGCKYWQKADWQKVVDFLISKGYKVINVSKEKNPLKGVEQIQDSSLENTIHTIYHSDFMIGLSSGLSWLAWALQKHVVMIANFTAKDYEFTSNCTRIVNTTVCHDCWKSNRLDAGDWNWCPVHKGTERQFECQRALTADMVIEQIQMRVLHEIPIVEIEEETVIDKFDWGWMNTPKGQGHKAVILDEMRLNLYEKEFEVEEGDIVFDIGASVGTFTYSILDKKPKRVYCIEPSENEFPSLIQNTLDHPVICINKGIAPQNGKTTSDQIFGDQTIMDGITFIKLCALYKVTKIDFLKTDCEGGEYDIFTLENLPFIKERVKKIVGEFHLLGALTEKFRYFRDNILTEFDTIKVYSIDGTDITYDLWNEHFLEYYSEVIIHIDNR